MKWLWTIWMPLKNTPISNIKHYKAALCAFVKHYLIYKVNWVRLFLTLNILNMYSCYFDCVVV